MDNITVPCYPPIRCPTCGLVLGNCWNAFNRLVKREEKKERMIKKEKEKERKERNEKEGREGREEGEEEDTDEEEDQDKLYFMLGKPKDNILKELEINNDCCRRTILTSLTLNIIE